MTSSRTLVAGIGNVFFGDDGFGVEVVRRLAQRPPSEDVCIVDFGIRGFDLTYALLDYDRVILVDAAPRGRAPGTLYVLEPEVSAIGESGARADFGHGLVPERALSLAQALGGGPRFVRVVGCEPARMEQGDDILVGLSPPVAAAVDDAVALIEGLLEATDA